MRCQNTINGLLEKKINTRSTASLGVRSPIHEYRQLRYYATGAEHELKRRYVGAMHEQSAFSAALNYENVRSKQAAINGIINV
mgnify:FL=1